MLNFDPHRWIVERERTNAGRSVASVASVAGLHCEIENAPAKRQAATVATTATKSQPNPAAILKKWHTRLAPLDFDHAPDGFTLERWRQLHRDSWWIYENFASGAVRGGWSANDLFGVFPSRSSCGGLCDRLKGARNLKMAGPKAFWSNWGVADWICSGAGDSLVKSGLQVIWEFQSRRPAS